MFVLEALLLTFLTTPAVVALYPPKYRTRAVPSGPNFANVAGGAGERDDTESTRKGSAEMTDDDDGWKQRITVVLDKAEHLPGMMAVTQLLKPPAENVDEEKPAKRSMHSVSVEALRLIELSDHAFSGVMKSSVAESLLHTDPLLNVFRTFGELHDLPVSTALSVVGYNDWGASVAEHATSNRSELIVLPWLPPASTMSTSISDTDPPASSSFGPTNSFFRPATNTHSQPSAVHAQFIRGAFAQAPCDVALLMDRGRAPGTSRAPGNKYHLLLPFFGGPDDRLALDLVIQLCVEQKVKATVLRITKKDEEKGHSNDESPVRPGDMSPHNMTIHTVRFMNIFAIYVSLID